jgi:hypothetical protein
MSLDEMVDFIGTVIPHFDKERAKKNYQEFTGFWANGFAGGAFLDGRLADHPSWPARGGSIWTKLPDERFDQFGEISVDLPGAPDNAVADADGMLAILMGALAGKTWRHTHVHFTIGGAHTEVAELLNRVWDGMRPLPYTSRHLAMAIFGTYVGPTLPSQGDLEEDSKRMSIEMGGMNGQGTRLSCSISGLQRALRPDIDDVLALDRRGERQMSVLLIWAFTPRKLFAFEPFVDLFASEIIPAQLYSSRKDAMIFSPLSVHAFGLP